MEAVFSCYVPEMHAFFRFANEQYFTATGFLKTSPSWSHEMYVLLGLPCKFNIWLRVINQLSGSQFS